MSVTATTRNLYLSPTIADPVVHAPHPDDPEKAACGATSRTGRVFKTLNAVTCERCGRTRLGLDQFESWDSPKVVGEVEDNGDSVGVRIFQRDVPGVTVSVDIRIKPEDLDRFIARLTEIKEARGL